MTTYKAVLNNRSLLILALSESVSSVGTWITMMAVFAMIVFNGKGGVAQSSGIYLAGLIPTLVFSPVAGWLCDHLDRKRLMIASELASGLIITGVIFTSRLDLVYVLLALQSISTSIMSPARQAVVPDLIRREDLTSANAFLQQLSSLIKISAPILAGALLAVMNPHEAVILDVISFVISAAVLTRLPRLLPHIEPTIARTILQPKQGASSDVLSTLRASPRLSLLFLLVFLAVVIFIGFDVLAPIYIRDILKGNESLFGTLVGLIGLGSLVSTAVLMLRSHASSPWRDVMAGLVFLGVIPVSMALGAAAAGSSVAGSSSAAVVLVGVGCLLGGVGNGLLNIQVSTLLQLLSPAEVLGRISGIFQSTTVAGQLAGILVTPLFVPALLSLGAYFEVASLAVALLVLLTAGILMRTRTTPQRAAVPGD
jgi:MFS family permease